MRRRAERVIRPSSAKTRRLRVLVITVRSPRLNLRCPAGQVMRHHLDRQPCCRLAEKNADGMRFRPTPYLRSRMAFSTSAWRR